MARALKYNCVLFKSGYPPFKKMDISLKIVRLDNPSSVLDYLQSNIVDKYPSKSIDDLVYLFIKKGWSLDEADKVTTIDAPYVDAYSGYIVLPVKEKDLMDFYTKYHEKIKNVINKL